MPMNRETQPRAADPAPKPVLLGGRRPRRLPQPSYCSSHAASYAVQFYRPIWRVPLPNWPSTGGPRDRQRRAPSRAPRTLFTANPRGAVGVYPSATGGGCWGVVHIARAGTTIAL